MASTSREVKAILRALGLRPRKSLSQNFLVNPRVARQMLGAVDPDMATLEIGGGLGALSVPLCAKLRGRFLTVEIDTRLVDYLRRVLESPKCEVLCADALSIEWNFEQVVSTVPYHLTSELIVKLVRSNDVRRAVLVLQREVAQRLLSEPGTRSYGRLTALVRSTFNVRAGPLVRPSDFLPRPEVFSQVVLLERHTPYNASIRALEELTKRIFSQRNRRAHKVLMEHLKLDEQAIRAMGVSEAARVRDLSPEVLLRLAEHALGNTRYSSTGSP